MTTTPPPIGEVYEPGNIPGELKAMARWSPWRAQWNEKRGKWDKIPGHSRSTAKPETWLPFEAAQAELQANPTAFAGLGFVVTGLPEFTFIDIDNCIDEAGAFSARAIEIIAAVASYTEISPSGRGLRIVARGASPEDWNNHDLGVEVYAGHAARFLTITGDACSDGVAIRDITEATQAELRSRYGKSSAPRLTVIPGGVPPMPEVWPEVVMPDIDTLDLPADTLAFLLEGLDDGDGSAAVHAAGVRLYSLGLSDQMVLSTLVNSHAMDVAMRHRGDNEIRATQYLWVEHCVKAKPKATTREEILAMFDDLGPPPGENPGNPGENPGVEPRIGVAPKAERFRIETAPEFAVRRKSTWLCKGIVPHATLGVIYGASGSGKTFLAFDLIATLTLGRDWRGHRTPRPIAPLWIAAEGVEDMRKRLTGACQHMGVALADLNMRFIGEAPNFLEEIDVKALLAQIKKQGSGFDVIIIDTLAQVMPGGNENSGEDMGKVLGYCKAISRATGAMVILIHHSGKDESKGARGWSGLRAASDFEIEVLRLDDDRVATVTKMKGGLDGGEYGFELLTVVVGQDDDGDDETTCVVQFTDVGRQSVAGQKAGKKEIDPKAIWQPLVLEQAKALLEINAGVLTQAELVTAVLERRPFVPDPDRPKRDQRGGKVNGAITELVASGHLFVDDNGRVTLPNNEAGMWD
jgi:hypothetical protein